MCQHTLVPIRYNVGLVTVAGENFVVLARVYFYLFLLPLDLSFLFFIIHTTFLFILNCLHTIPLFDLYQPHRLVFCIFYWGWSRYIYFDSISL